MAVFEFPELEYDGFIGAPLLLEVPAVELVPLFPASPTVADLSGADLPGPATLPLGPPDKPEPAAPAPIPPDPLTPALPALVPVLVPAAVPPAPCAKAFEVNVETASDNAAANIAFDTLFFIA
ncbi:MAG: hypothetical protein WAN07_15390 [Candidatus Binatus sp.]